MKRQRVRIDDPYFLAMEYAKGVNLSELVTKRGPLLISTRCRYIRQAALAERSDILSLVCIK